MEEARFPSGTRRRGVERAGPAVVGRTRGSGRRYAEETDRDATEREAGEAVAACRQPIAETYSKRLMDTGRD
ncbi:unnamed protein product [Xylocopa violacea]|uniref:Uncharacterized protein n=1 Tax=Xylocopa violacea TaxID=135666 RepID=A0ABP1MYW1_XYLVO